MMETYAEIISGKLVKLVDCVLILKKVNNYVTVPTSRILKIEHKELHEEGDVGTQLNEVFVTVYLKPEKDSRLEKW